MYLSALSLALNRPGAVSLEQVVASLFAAGEQGAWYDPSAANVTWRRNLLTYTEQFDNAAWAKIGTAPTITANDAAAPDGTATADRILFNASSISNRLQQTLTGYDGPITLSIYLKGNVGGETIKLSDGWTVSSTLTLTTAWVRYSATFAGNAGSAFYMLYADSGTPTVYAWGAQFERSSSATPYQRIVTPEITYLADVQSQPLLFTDSTGAAPVTGVEQPVGLILDRRKGLALGPELLDGVAGTVTGTWAYSASNVITRNSSSTGQCGTQVQAVAGRTYLISFTVTNKSGDSFFFRCGNTASPEISANGTYTYRITASSNIAAFVAYPWAGTTGEATITLHSIKLLDGNHAYQTGSAARPVLRARYNLLTYSEQFDNAAWANAGGGATISANSIAAPDGTTTADTMIEAATSGNRKGKGQTASFVSGATYTCSVYAKAKERSFLYMIFPGNAVSSNRAAGFTLTGAGSVSSLDGSTVASIVPLANGWYRCSVTATATATASGALEILLADAGNLTATNPSYTGDGTSGIYLWGADLRVGTSAGDYQRIASGTFPADYATTSTITGQPFRPYLQLNNADGTGDYLTTATLDFSATDNVFICAGVAKTALRGGIVELSPNANLNNGGFYLSFGSSVNADNAAYTSWSRGTNTSFANTANNYAPPITNVVSSLLDISASQNVLRVDGVQAASDATSQGTGNYGSYPMTVGGRVVGDRLFGYIYGLIVRAGTTSAGQIAAAESYMASKTGVTL